MENEELIDDRWLKTDVLIAVFMNCTRKVVRFQEKIYNSSNEYYWDWTEGELWVDQSGDPLDDENDCLLYCTSWEWLMPVVEKINRMKHHDNSIRVIIFPEYCQIDFGANTIGVDGTFMMVGDDSKANVYNAIVGFINWYNIKQNNGK